METDERATGMKEKEKENEKWPKNLTENLALLVTSLPILCSDWN